MLRLTEPGDRSLTLLAFVDCAQRAYCIHPPLRWVEAISPRELETPGFYPHPKNRHALGAISAHSAYTPGVERDPRTRPLCVQELGSPHALTRGAPRTHCLERKSRHYPPFAYRSMTAQDAKPIAAMSAAEMQLLLEKKQAELQRLVRK